jgi:hypothetical protein
MFIVIHCHARLMLVRSSYMAYVLTIIELCFNDFFGCHPDRDFGWFTSQDSPRLVCPIQTMRRWYVQCRCQQSPGISTCKWGCSIFLEPVPYFLTFCVCKQFDILPTRRQNLLNRRGKISLRFICLSCWPTTLWCLEKMRKVSLHNTRIRIR